MSALVPISATVWTLDHVRRLMALRVCYECGAPLGRGEEGVCRDCEKYEAERAEFESHRFDGMGLE